MQRCFNFFGASGVRILSVNSITFPGGANVSLDTIIEIIKLINIPRVPIPSGEIPNQKSSESQNP